MKILGMKAGDFLQLKTMKNIPPALKISLIAVCVLTDAVTVDTTVEATAKRMVWI